MTRRILGILAGALLAACGQGSAGSVATAPGGDEETRDRVPALPAALDGQHYVLRAGELVPKSAVELADEAAEHRFQSWTVQSRVISAASIGGATFLAVNGFGFVCIEYAPSAVASFTYFYDPALLGGHTLTNLFDWNGQPTGHIYVDQLLAPQSEAASSERSRSVGAAVNLVRLRDGVLLSTASPHKALDPRWQSVTVVQVAANEALLEWKLGDRRGTRFQYTRLRLAATGATEVAVDRAAFLAGYAFRGVSDPEVPVALRTLARDVIDQLRPAERGAFHFVLRRRAGVTNRLRFQPDGYESLQTIPLVETEASYFALLPGGWLRQQPRDGAALARQHLLPALPEGFSYIDLYLINSAVSAPMLLAVWEQSRFYRVGAAGLTLVPLP